MKVRKYDVQLRRFHLANIKKVLPPVTQRLQCQSFFGRGKSTKNSNLGESVNRFTTILSKHMFTFCFVHKVVEGRRLRDRLRLGRGSITFTSISFRESEDKTSKRPWRHSIDIEDPSSIKFSAKVSVWPSSARHAADSDATANPLNPAPPHSGAQDVKFSCRSSKTPDCANCLRDNTLSLLWQRKKIF
jgi:hypothetical protein